MSDAPEDADLWQAGPKPEFLGKGGIVTVDAGIDEALTELVAQSRK
jgi:2,3-dihydroxy-p-cumate/2,3-dihydroxybenzoate 3,4-dioxygenase